MIHDIDESLRALVRRDVLNGANVEVAFDAPTRDWSSRRNTPTINFYLYDIREDLTRRPGQFEEVRDANGRVASRRLPPRQFKLSYMITAWTQRAEDEHRLLSAVLMCLLRFDALPYDVYRGEVVEELGPLRITVGLPLSADRSISDVWSALGGELKPSIDLVVGAPFDPGRSLPIGPEVFETRLLSRQAVDLAALAAAGEAERETGAAVITSEMRRISGDPATGEVTGGAEWRRSDAPPKSPKPATGGSPKPPAQAKKPAPPAGPAPGSKPGSKHAK